MARKFLKLVENTITRMSNGSFLTGDLVKLAKNYKSKDSYKKLNDAQKEYIDTYFDSDKNYYIVNVKTDALTPGLPKPGLAQAEHPVGTIRAPPGVLPGNHAFALFHQRPVSGRKCFRLELLERRIRRAACQQNQQKDSNALHKRTSVSSL